MAQTGTIRNHAAFIWSVGDLLRGDYKQSKYGKVILPLTVIRRLKDSDGVVGAAVALDSFTR
jgi:type I restriction-modification system DNA methylase subunit